MKQALRILHLEDDPADARLVRDVLRRDGVACEITLARDRDEFLAALNAGTYDLIISDHNLPQYDGVEAFQESRSKGHDVPFISVSGTLGEDLAVEVLKQGVTDYVLKERLSKLPFAVRRAIEEHEMRLAREHAEEELRLALNHLEHLVTASPAVLYACEPTGSWATRYVTDNIKAQFGYEPRELRENPSFWGEHIHPEDRARLAAIVPELLRTGTAVIQCRLRRADGVYRWVHNHMRVVHAADGTSLECIGSLSDVSDIVVAEQARQASEERYRALAEASPDMIFILDREGRTVFANSRLGDLLQVDPARLVGRHFAELGAPERVELHEGDVQRVMQTGAMVTRESCYRIRNKDCWLDVRLVPLRDPHGAVQAVMGVLRDVTEKRQLEQQYLRAQRLESIGALASGIAHDLNNVLSPILMGVEYLRDSLQDARYAPMLEAMEESARRGADMIRQVLAFGRGLAGERGPIQVRHLLRDIEKVIGQTFPKSIRVVRKTARDLWTVVGDATQLHQVMMNLCVNARDAMPAGGTLSIEAENLRLGETAAQIHPDAKPGPYVVLKVADTGVGISPDTLPKIFDPFFTTKESGKGTGLGLATAHGLVKAHGGFMTVSSEVGRGSRFRVYLPGVEAEDGATGPEEETPPPGTGELILVVDDEEALRAVTKATLEASGYQVLTANDGAQAVALFAQYRTTVRAVVLDMMMPIMDGPATLRALQTLLPSIPVLTVSGLPPQPADVAGENVLFLAKPFTKKELLIRLHELISRV